MTDVRIVNGKLVIEMDLDKPHPSASGKTMIVATTSGNIVTSATVQGRPVILGLNAYIKP